MPYHFVLNQLPPPFIMNSVLFLLPPHFVSLWHIHAHYSHACVTPTHSLCPTHTLPKDHHLSCSPICQYHKETTHLILHPCITPLNLSLHFLLFLLRHLIFAYPNSYICSHRPMLMHQPHSCGLPTHPHPHSVITSTCHYFHSSLPHHAFIAPNLH